MKMKKVLALALTAALALSLTGCLNQAPAGNGGASTPSNNSSSAGQSGGASTSTPASNPDGAPAITSTQQVNMIWSHNAAVTTAGHRAAEKFKEAMEKYSNGNITVTLYANGELGTVPENDQALREGTIQIGSGTTGGLVDPSLSYFDCPNLVDSNEQAKAMMDRSGELYKYTEDVYANIGMKMLSIVPGGFREDPHPGEPHRHLLLAGLGLQPHPRHLLRAVHRPPAGTGGGPGERLRHHRGLQALRAAEVHHQHPPRHHVVRHVHEFGLL